MFHPLPNSPQQFAITLSELLASRDARQLASKLGYRAIR